MEGAIPYLVFTLDDQRYALALTAVLSVIRAVQLTPIPEGPENLMGLVNMGGEIIPVLDIRRRFHLPSREMELDDRIIVCKQAERTVAFVTDEVLGMVELEPEEVDEAVEILPEMEDRIKGVGKLNDHTVLIYDLEMLFSPEEIDALDTDHP